MLRIVDPSSWLLSKAERDNPQTVLDDVHAGQQAWSTGNLVIPLIHGSTYFRRLYDVVEATRPGDLLFFTDWQGDADERLTGEPDSEVVEVFCRADERGVDVRGLVWRSHTDLTGFFAKENRHFGEQMQQRGAEVLLDMRVRAGGSHHQKFVVVRHRDDPSRDVAFVGGMDLAHNRRDDADHGGDPQPQPLTEEYGAHPPWHDVQVEIHGPAVYDVETVFRERWEDPTPLSRSPLRKAVDLWRHHDTSPDGLPPQAPPPPPAGPHTVQLLRTYPDLRHGRDYPFARGGERSVARGYSKAIARAERVAYVEDQYFWGHDVADPFESALRAHPELRLVVVIPLVPDIAGLNRIPQLLGRERALGRLMRAAPGRVAAYGLENRHGTPIYVHAKVCVIDDVWASTGSDNFNRRSWTHDSEISCAIVDSTLDERPPRDPGGLGDGARRLARDTRLRLWREHLGRDALAGPDDDLVEPAAGFATLARSAHALEDWYGGGCRGTRPPGRLRPHRPDRVAQWTRVVADPFSRAVLDPDGRPRTAGGRRSDR